jgi:hypothetical protein
MQNRKLFLLFFLFHYMKSLSSGLFDSTEKQKIVMINPAGDAKNIGRKLSSNHESAIAFKLCEQLAKTLENRYNMKVILTRIPGDELTHLQTASLANRANIDLFLDVNIYKEEREKPRLYLYNLVRNPITDLAKHSLPPVSFIPTNMLHINHIHKTKSFGERIKMVLMQQEYQKIFDFYGTYGIPIRSLEGINAPALFFDLGLNEEEKLTYFIEPLVASLKFLLEY